MISRPEFSTGQLYLQRQSSTFFALFTLLLLTGFVMLIYLLLDVPWYIFNETLIEECPLNLLELPTFQRLMS